MTHSVCFERATETLLRFQNLQRRYLSLIHIWDANTSASVIEIINLLDEVLGAKTFNSLFPAVSYTHLDVYKRQDGNEGESNDNGDLFGQL